MADDEQRELISRYHDEAAARLGLAALYDMRQYADESRIKIDGVEVGLSKLSPKPGDLLVLRCDGPAPDVAAIQQFMANAGFEKVFILPCGMTLEAMSDEQLSHAGLERLERRSGVCDCCPPGYGDLHGHAPTCNTQRVRR